MVRRIIIEGAAWLAAMTASTDAVMRITGLPRPRTRCSKRKAKPAPSTPTSKRAKVKAARKQRLRNG